MTSTELLFSNLENTYTLHIEMKQLAEQKKNALITGNIDELSKIIHKESLWIKKIKDLEETRINIISELLKVGNSISSDITLLDLLGSNHISKIEATKLKEIYDKLVGLFDEIKKQNEVNTQLITQSIEFVTNSLKTITEEPAQSSTYSKPTSNKKDLTSSTSSTRIFDKKV